MSNKKRRELRREMRKVVSSLDERWIRAASSELCENLVQLLGEVEASGRSIRHILAWTRFFPGEVDLTSFIARQLSSRKVYLPRSLPDKTMQYLEISENWSEQVEEGNWGIPEPKVESGTDFLVEDAENTLVLVPGLAFDGEGNRIGRGQGYYDRFLGRAELRNVVKVGILWKLQLLSEVPTQSHDVPMDWLCHEEGIRRVSMDFDDDF